MRVSISILVILSLSVSTLMGQVFINEVSYTDSDPNDRGVELAGPAGTDVTNWYMEFRDDNNTLYHTETVNAPAPTTIDNESASGRGGIWIPVATLQNQDDNTIILYDNTGTAQDTVSYGSPFASYVSSNIGVVQLPGTTVQNLELDDNDAVWWVATPATKGDLNAVSQLPVELISFDAKVVEQFVQISWITATETNNSHFEIERSNDGVIYETIGIVDGNGTTFEEQYYDFEDNNVSEGRNYYRLKQIDLDGQFEYSEVIVVDFSTKLSVAIAPNPITQNSRLNIQISRYENVDLIIFDMTGKVMKAYRNIDENGIYINGLSSGMYIYQIQQQQKLIKTDRLVIID